MAFPVGPTNGSTTVVNGIVYSYSTTDNAWSRLSTSPGNLTVTGNLTSSGNLIAANVYFGNIAWANGVPLSLSGTYSNTNVAAYLTESTVSITGNLTSSGNLIAANVYFGNIAWANGVPLSLSGTYSNTNVAAYLTTGTVSITALSVGTGVQVDSLNLNNNNLYNVNTIRINDPGSSEGISWEGGSGWNIYESPNDLSNATGNLQFVVSGVRALTVDTNQTVNIPSTWATTSATTGALTVGGGVGIGGNLYVAGNIFASNLVSINTTTLTVQDPLLYLAASNPSPYNYDIGFFSHFVGGSLTRYQHSGFARNVDDSTWTLFSNVFAEPGATISWTEANIIYDPIKVGSANVANTTISTSTTTGALTVGGGLGVVGNVYANTIYTTTGIRWAGNGVAFSSGGGGGTVDYVASPTAPVSPDNGDFWYKTTTGILFQYLSDGTNSYWFDVQTQAISGNVTVSSTSASDILSPFLFGGM